MRVADANITPIAVADPPLLNAAGLHAPYALRIVLELVSDDGLSGWGEIPGSKATRAALEHAAGQKSSARIPGSSTTSSRPWMFLRRKTIAANRPGIDEPGCTSAAPSKSPVTT